MLGARGRESRKEKMGREWERDQSIYVCMVGYFCLCTLTMQDYVPLWQKQCMDGGCSLTPCHFQPSALAQFPVVRSNLLCSVQSCHRVTGDTSWCVYLWRCVGFPTECWLHDECVLQWMWQEQYLCVPYEGKRQPVRMSHLNLVFVMSIEHLVICAWIYSTLLSYSTTTA